MKTNGMLGLFQGFLPTLLRDTVAVSMYFGAYEWVRRACRKPGEVCALFALLVLDLERYR